MKRLLLFVLIFVAVVSTAFDGGSGRTIPDQIGDLGDMDGEIIRTLDKAADKIRGVRTEVALIGRFPSPEWVGVYLGQVAECDVKTAKARAWVVKTLCDGPTLTADVAVITGTSSYRVGSRAKVITRLLATSIRLQGEKLREELKAALFKVDTAVKTEITRIDGVISNLNTKLADLDLEALKTVPATVAQVKIDLAGLTGRVDVIEKWRAEDVDPWITALKETFGDPAKFKEFVASVSGLQEAGLTADVLKKFANASLSPERWQQLIEDVAALQTTSDKSNSISQALCGFLIGLYQGDNHGADLNGASKKNRDEAVKVLEDLRKGLEDPEHKPNFEAAFRLLDAVIKKQKTEENPEHKEAIKFVE